MITTFLKKREQKLDIWFLTKDLIIVPRDRNNAQDFIIEGYRFTMMKIENRNYLRILCKWKRENSWEDSRRAAQNDTDTLLQEPRSLCIWVMPLYLMFAFSVVYLHLYLYPNIYFNRQLDALKIVKKTRKRKWRIIFNTISRKTQNWKQIWNWKKVKYEQDKSTKNPLANTELKTSHWK